MGAAEPGVGQQLPHLLVPGDQPRLVTGRGADLVDSAPGLEGPEAGRGRHRVRLLERQLGGSGHGIPPLVYVDMYTLC